MSVTEIHHDGAPAGRGGLELGSFVRWGVAAASVAAAVPHCSAVSDHRHLPLMAWAFVVSAAVQFLWAGFAVRRFSPAVMVVGAGVNAAMVCAWAISRTSGLGFVPGAEEGREPLGFKDVSTV